MMTSVQPVVQLSERVLRPVVRLTAPESSPRRPPVFVGAKTFRQNKNHLQTEHFFNLIPEKAHIALGLNVDSEFQTQGTDPLFDSSQKAKARQFVTVQVSDFLNQHPSLFFHPDAVVYAQEKGLKNRLRHPVATSECIAVDYLRSQGYHVNMIYDDRALTAKRTIRVTLCAFFMVVDLYACFQGDCLAFVEEAILEKKLVHQRHFHFVREPGFGGQKDFRLPYFLDIDGQRFALIVDFLDLVGAQGKITFKDFCKNVGIALPSKDLVGGNITRMMDYCFEEPAIYDAYASGDLMLYPAWKEYCRYIQDLSAKMIGEEFSVDPALTIGSTTNKILDGKRLQYLGFHPHEIKSQIYESILGRDILHTLDDEENPAHSQLKVDGGRCHNNCPTQAVLSGALCDLDLKGAYASAMMVIPSFFGNPTSLCLSNERLKSVFKKYRKHLLPYHWTMRISTMVPLSFDQDLIPSYFDYTWKERKNDTESFHETGELDYESGKAKIFSREIMNGMLTSDVLDVILHTWSSPAREEFFSKVGVISLLYYDPANEIKDKQAFSTNFFQQWVGGQDPDLWHSLPLKDLGIADFRDERSKHAKGTPMNVLYKLLGNTSYGAIVSHFFDAQNPVTANQITAHVRVAVYLAEKCLGFYQTITDGGIFDLNGVLMPKRKGSIFTDKLCNYLTLSKREINHHLNLKRTGLGGFHWRVEGSSRETLSVYKNNEQIPTKEAEELLNRLCLEHMKNIFPTMPLLQNPHLAFEMKSFFNQATFHGSSNYGFWFGDTLDSLKMRGYENKRHWGY